MLIALILLIGGALGYYYFIYDNPVDIVYKFTNAVNERDLNTAVECLDPEKEMAYKGINAVFSKFVGFGTSDVANLIPFLYKTLRTEGNYSDPYFKIAKITSKEIHGDNTKITVLVELDITDKNNNRRKEIGNGVFYL